MTDRPSQPEQAPKPEPVRHPETPSRRKRAPAVAPAIAEPPSFRTEIVRVDPRQPADADLIQAAGLLRAGAVVAFPTETVYGLGANALDPAAVRAIFAAKGRPADNPLIVHVASLTELRTVVARLPDIALSLIDRFMPGPLTLILPRAAQVPDAVTAGLDTVAVRMPAHPVALRLIELAGVPVAGPSANRSGRPSPTTAGHVLEDMDGRIPLIVDGGPCDFGVESTVLDVTGTVPVILRPGAVTIEELRAVAGTVWTVSEAEAAVRHAAEAARLEPPSPGAIVSDQPAGVDATRDTRLERTTEPAAPRSPGMKYRHYAPQTPVRIAEGDSPADRTAALVALALAEIASGRKPAVFCSIESADQLRTALPAGWAVRDLDAPSDRQASADSDICLIAFGSRGQARAAARRLFAALRQLDTCGASVIIAEGIDPEGLGAAYLNRLRKAAGGGVEPIQGGPA